MVRGVLYFILGFGFGFRFDVGGCWLLAATMTKRRAPVACGLLASARSCGKLRLLPLAEMHGQQMRQLQLK